MTANENCERGVRRHYRSNQDRMGRASRRRLEYNAVMYNVRRRKGKFIARLTARLVKCGEECLCYRGTLDHKGYARLNLSYKPVRAVRAVVISIHAQRLFLILKLGRPIARGYEAGHDPVCDYRTCVFHLREEHYRSNAATNTA